MQCIYCGCLLIIGFTWRDSDKTHSRYICTDCDNTYRAQYQLTHMEKHRLSSLHYYHKHQKQCIVRDKCYKLSRSKKAKFIEYKSKAKKHDREFTLTEDEFTVLLNKPCAYCGQVSSGLDRVDNEKGYTKDNVVPCCKYCNIGKNNLTVQQYIERCKLVVKVAS